MKKAKFFGLKLLVVFALSLVFSGCGGGSDNTNNSSTQDTTQITNNLEIQNSYKDKVIGATSNEELDNVANEILQNEAVSNVTVHHDTGNIDIEYKNGMLGGIEAPFDRSTTKGANKSKNTIRQLRSVNNIAISNSKVLSLALQYWDWGDNDDIPEVTKLLETDGSFTITKKFQTKNNGDLELFKDMDDYGIILLSSHGSRYTVKDKKITIINSNLKKSLTNNIKYFSDLWNGNLIIKTTPIDKSKSEKCNKDSMENCIWTDIYNITPSFINKYNKNFKNTVIYMSICNGAFNNSLANAFIDNGASVYLGYSDVVGVSFAKQHGTDLFKNLLSKDEDNTYKNIGQSFTSGIKETDDKPAEFLKYSDNNLIAIKANDAITIPLSSTIDASDGTYDNKIKITWDKVDDATYYELYESSSYSGTYSESNFSPIYITSVTTARTTDEKLYYKIKACNTAGCSSYSNINSGYANIPITIPSAPINVRASDGTYSDKISISWNSVSNADYYNIYWTTSSYGTYTKFSNKSYSANTTITGGGVDSGTKYYYKIKACNTAGCSSYSSYNSGYADVPNLIPEVTDLEFDKSDSSKIKITTKYKANDGSGIDYVYWKVINPNNQNYNHNWDTDNNYYSGTATHTISYASDDIFNTDGTYTVESYVKNEDGTYSSTYSETVYIDVPSNEKPEVTDLEFDKSDSSKIKITTKYKANDGSGIDYIYWKIISPSGKTYSSNYDTGTNYYNGSAYTTKTYTSYDVFDMDGTYTVESYVKNEDGTYSSTYSETVYIDVPSNEVLQGASGDPRINLDWSGSADLDLRVIDPCNNEIDYSNRQATCSGYTGQLDIDANYDVFPSNPQENITWTNGGSSGSYKIYIENQDSSEEYYTITIINNGYTTTKTGYVSGYDEKYITTISH